MSKTLLIRSYVSVMIALLLALTPLLTSAAPEVFVNDSLTRPSSAEYVPGEVVVKYHDSNERFQVLSVPSVSRALEALQKNPNVAFAHPNYVATVDYVPNDQLYSLQWNFDGPGTGDVQAEAAWDITRGSGVTVAVIDSGIAYTDSGRYKQAPDLAETCFVPGYDFVNNDAEPVDDNGHGTHVAGTIAQSTNNNLGTAGLASESCLMPLKAMNAQGGGTYTDIANAIYFAADNGADVINMSLSGPTSAIVLEEALAYAKNAGVTMVASSGNDNGTIGYPAAYDEYVIAVGATRYDATRAYYSNFGPELDLVAPGGDINVDQNADGYADGILQQTFGDRPNDFGYYFYQGTSMSAPHVAAAAALLVSNGNATNPDDIQSALQETATGLGASGWDDEYGHGLVNIPAALAWNAGPVNEAPTVEITSPVEGATATGSITLAASATDTDDGVQHVTFFVDGVEVGSDVTAPFAVNWDSTTVVDGSVTITAEAADTVQVASDSVTVTVDNVNDAPMANAGEDQTLVDSNNDGEIFTLDGSSSYDPDGTIATYEWYEGATWLAGTSAVDLVRSVGNYTFTLVVTDDEGKTDSDEVDVTIKEEVVSPIVLSANGYKDRGQHVIDLAWNGASSDVEIYRNDSLVATGQTVDGLGEYTDATDNRGGASYTYQICEVESSTCSDTVTVTF